MIIPNNNNNNNHLTTIEFTGHLVDLLFHYCMSDFRGGRDPRGIIEYRDLDAPDGDGEF